MSALDELLGKWRSNPDADATIALCSFLGVSPREELIREVSTSADTWHSADARVMLAVGRMHLDAGYLSEAQAALVAAGKASGRDAKPFRYLGEVLLRRGDALRAEKVLARALQLGPNDREARIWHDRSVLYSALQQRIGVGAVAAEVSRTMPKQNSIPPPTLQPSSSKGFGNEELTMARAQNPVSAARKPGSPPLGLPRFESEEPLHVSSSDLETEEPAPRPPAQARAARATTLGMGPPGPKLPGAAAKAPSFAPRSNAAPVPKRAPDPPARFDEVITTVTPSPFVAPWPEPAAAPARAPRARPSVPPPPAPPPVRPPPSPAAPRAAAPRAALRSAETLEFVAPAAALAAPLAADVSAPLVVQPSARPHPINAPPASNFSDERQPSPGLVLEHLSRVGVYEPTGGAPPAWEQPRRQRARGTWTLAVSIGLVAAAGAGSYVYSQKVRRERLAHAAALNGDVKKLLETGSVSDLRQTDAKLRASFELDSLSPLAARLWLQNRVLYELLTGTEVRGIDAAVQRGQSVNLPEKDSAFGQVASFMAEGDLAGGAAILTRWDKDSAGDPYYQLTAGAVLERAGDLRAIERYETARKLDPELVPAHLLLARLLLLEFGSERAKPVMNTLRAKLGAAPITRALSALAWVVDPERPEALPEDALLAPDDADKLPAPLHGVPAMVEAVQAMRSGDMPKASHAIDAAVTSAMTPSLATGLGFLAIEAGDEQLARKAALRALQFAAVYPRARMLAARVALLGGRLDEAQKAIEELDPASPDVAVVRSVVAYESLQPGEMAAALHALGDAAVTRQAYAALALGPGLLTGRAFPTPEKIAAISTPATTWGELIAADAALDIGDSTLAAKILAERKGDAVRPVHYLRLARLYRYQNKGDDALKASAAAREGATTASVLLETLYALLQKGDADGARTLVAKHATVLGPLSAWPGVLVDAGGKQKAQAAARAAKLDLPPSETPLALRILVARALAVSGDKRARPYVLALAKQAPKHPDVVGAALELK